MTQEQINQLLQVVEAAYAKSVRLRDALAFSEVEVSLDRSWCRLCRTEGRGEARGRYSHPHAANCVLHEALELPVREACRRKMPLSGVDAHTLEAVLSTTEQERDEAQAEVERFKSLVRAADDLIEDLREQKAELLTECQRMREVVRQVHTLAAGSVESGGFHGDAIRDILRITKVGP